MEDELTMKKIIALLLTLIMAFSAVIAVSASETGDETATPVKPIIRGIQASEDGTAVRFLATLQSEAGDAVGFNVKVNYIDNTGKLQTENYSKIDGDDNMESRTVYTTVKAAGSEVTLETLAEGDENACGIFAAVISEIPTGTDVTFEVTAYVKSGTEYVYSSTTTEKFSNGEMRQYTEVYNEDFDIGTKALKGGTYTPSISKDALTMTPQGWGNAFWQIVPGAALNNKLDKYMVEMDVTLNKIGVFGIFMNSDSADPYADNGTVFVVFRLGTKASNYTNNNTATPIDGTKDLYFSAGGVTTSPQQKKNVLAKDIATGATSVSFKLTIAVDSTDSNGCKVYLYVDGTYIDSYELSNDYDSVANGYISAWAQQVDGTIDNLKVSSFTDVSTTVAPSATDTVHTNNYNLSDYGIAKTPEYNHPSLSIGGGELTSTGGGWKSHSTVIAKGATFSDCYAVSMQLDLTTVSGGNTLFVFNNDGNATTAAAFHKYAVAVKFDWSNSTGVGFFVRKYNSSGGQESTNIVDVDILKSAGWDIDYTNFKFTIIIDSTPDNGCLFTILINDVYAASFALDNNYDVKANSAIEFWTEKTNLDVGISNITVGHYEKVGK